MKARSAGRVSSPRLRRSPYLVCYWSSGLTLYNYQTCVATRATPLAVELLEFFDSSRTVAEAQRRFSRFAPQKLARAIRSLERRDLLQRERAVSPRPAAGLSGWKNWNPAAGFFHFSTKDVRFVEALADGGPGGARAPSAVKRFPGAPRMVLPRPDEQGDFPRVLEGRRTWRRFSRGSLSLPSLATLLGLTFRLRRRAPARGDDRITLRTSPSPGARHALEAYVLALRVKGLSRGLYHYAADRHQLERLTSTATRKQLLGYLPTQYWYGDAAALVLITAVFPRVWWRYDYPRAYRAVLIEAGHFCQTFLLTATWLGLAPFCSMALADTRIEEDLGIDGVTESVLYAAGVGVRPPGVDWAPTPAPKAR